MFACCITPLVWPLWFRFRTEIHFICQWSLLWNTFHHTLKGTFNFSSTLVPSNCISMQWRFEKTQTMIMMETATTLPANSYWKLKVFGCDLVPFGCIGVKWSFQKTQTMIMMETATTLPANSYWKIEVFGSTLVPFGCIGVQWSFEWTRTMKMKETATTIPANSNFKSFD